MKKLLHVNKETNQVIAWIPVDDTATIEEFAPNESVNIYIVDDLPLVDAVEGEVIHFFYDGTTFTHEKKMREKTEYDKMQEVLENINSVEDLVSLKQQIKVLAETVDFILGV